MEQQRLLELALKSLNKELEDIEAERKRITGEIAAIRKQLTGKTSKQKKAKKRTLSAAQRKKQSKTMKQVWAKRQNTGKKAVV